VLAATADLAVVRLHGHSSRWDSRDIQQRFDYCYSHEELTGWVPRLRALAGDAAITHVLFNNCYQGYGQANAQQLTALLAGCPR
jgi:uncharacterized protein YecE (DUF72 family)